MFVAVIWIAFALVCVAMALNLWVLFRGPGAPDRVIALDTLYISGLSLLVVYEVLNASVLLLEAALLVALMGYVGTVALAKYLLRGDIIE